MLVKVDENYKGLVEPNEVEKKLLEKYEVIVELPDDMEWLQNRMTDKLAEIIVNQIDSENAGALADYLETHDF